MSDMIDTVKSLLMAASSLSSVKTWQKGILGPSCIFPAVAVLPNQERYVLGMTNNKCDVEREITIEVYEYKLNIKDARSITMNLLESIEDVFKDNLTVSGTTHSLVRGSARYLSTTNVKQGFMSFASLQIVAKTREDFLTSSISTTIQNNASLVQVRDSLISILRANKDTYYSSVNSIDYDPIKLINPPSAILVSVGPRRIIQSFTNIDVYDVDITIAILSRFYTKEKALNHNLSIFEGVKSVIMQNVQVGGYCEYVTPTYTVFEETNSFFGSEWYYLTTMYLTGRVRDN